MKYRGVANIYFDAPAQACIRLVEVDGLSLGSGGCKFDHLEQTSPDRIWCHALGPWSPPVIFPFGAVNIMRSCDGLNWSNYAITCGRKTCPANSTPIPEVNPSICTCIDGYEPDTTGTNCISRQYSVTLEPDRPTTGPSQALGFRVIVKDQTGAPPSSPVTIHLALSVSSNSGGHDHGDSARPRGGLNTTTCASDAPCIDVSTGTPDNGTGSFTFYPSDVSGTHTITPACDKCSGEPVSVDVKVKESDAAGWDSLTASPSDYQLIGGEAGKKHTDNHYLTATARETLQTIVEAYNKAYPDGPVLHLNDASLVWGGKFDISGKWRGDHNGHRRGKEIDIRANQLPSAISFWRFADFKSIAADNGAFASVHCSFPAKYSWACWFDTGDNRHFHVRLTGR